MVSISSYLLYNTYVIHSCLYHQYQSKNITVKGAYLQALPKVQQLYLSQLQNGSIWLAEKSGFAIQTTIMAESKVEE